MDSISGNLSGSVTPSIHAAARGTSIPTQTPLEFQLVVQYPKVYPPLAPLNAASLDLQLLGIQPLDAGITHDAGLSTLCHDNTSSTILDKIVQPQDVISRASFGPDNGIPIDPRLHHVDISHWTTVTISNQFAAEAISLYLNMNQPWWAFFDTDLFLDDLVKVETNFCSRMLVNALLAWATVSLRNCQVYIRQQLSLSSPHSKAMRTMNRWPLHYLPSSWMKPCGSTMQRKALTV
jgi:hypothetical protein